MDNEHFIGWLPMPASYRRAVIPAAVAVASILIVAGILVSLSQGSPGGGKWDDDPIDVEGIAFVDPCAMLRTFEAGQPSIVLLVEDGKFSAAERLAAFDGKPVRVRGTLLHRDGRKMLELLPGDEGLSATASVDDRLKEKRIEESGEVRLMGEIIDPKCYLGAMQPGGGKTHKACAALCLLGGIPPMLVAREGGKERFLLLLDESGRLATKEAVPLVGEPVVVEGTEGRIDDLAIVKAKTIRRR